MRPDAFVTLTSGERVSVAIWRRRTLAVLMAIATTAFALSLLADGAGRNFNAQEQEPSLRPMCALWDRHAREAIARYVQTSEKDVELRQLGDIIFRMRRARRSCEHGWVRIACQDYHAILRNVPGTSVEWSGATSVCPLAIADESPASDPPAR